MKDKTLLILAAGMGSRFGGLKQLTPFGPSGEFIIDYSIFDAIRNGFNKVIFIIKEENLYLFKESIGKRIEDYCEKNNVKVDYIFQNNNNIPSKFEIPADRVKPLGTAHAILCAKDKIKEPFVIINSDDFYGNDAFKVASEFIDTMEGNTIGLIGYDVDKTLTENGSVKRGVCYYKDGYLDKIVESEITVINEEIKAMPIEGGKYSILDRNRKVSMNMIVFFPEFMNYIEEKFEDFLSNCDLNKSEYLIPSVMSKGIEEGFCKVKIVGTSAKWVGVTYKEDTDLVKFYINSLVEDKIYNKNLWK